jgi:hypothetical protein
MQFVLFHDHNSADKRNRAFVVLFAPNVQKLPAETPLATEIASAVLLMLALLIATPVTVWYVLPLNKRKSPLAETVTDACPLKDTSAGTITFALLEASDGPMPIS